MKVRDWLRREWVEGELVGGSLHLKRGSLERPNASIRWFSVLPSTGPFSVQDNLGKKKEPRHCL